MAPKQLLFVSSLLYFAFLVSADGGAFDVNDYGARGDGKTDDTKAFMAAWKDTCAYGGNPKLVVPNSKYMVGPLKFTGPCPNAGTITVQIQGTLLGTTNLGKYPGQEWILFAWLNGLVVNGGGTLDGQGQSAWPYNNCRQSLGCKVLPDTLKIAYCNNTQITGITSLNPKMFHIVMMESHDVTISNVALTAPGTSPNTDGIHIETSTGVRITDCDIATGDDCISIGQGNTDIYIKGINCGPGHGISVGSLGRYATEKPVSGLIVTGCTFKNTLTGARIKSFQSQYSLTANNITFDNLIMENVQNPIIIDQTYCPSGLCNKNAVSHVKISDVTFSNIRGSASTANPVSLICSSGYPCENIKLVEINVDGVKGPANATCTNVKPSYSGSQNPPPCSSSA